MGLVSTSYKKGHPPTKPKGAKNRKTKQWHIFTEYCLNGGLEKFEKELNTLSGKDYVTAFVNLLEFHKPKLQRSEVKHEVPEDNKPVINITIDSQEALLK